MLTVRRISKGKIDSRLCLEGFIENKPLKRVQGRSKMTHILWINQKCDDKSMLKTRKDLCVHVSLFFIVVHPGAEGKFDQCVIHVSGALSHNG